MSRDISRDILIKKYDIEGDGERNMLSKDLRRSKNRANFETYKPEIKEEVHDSHSQCTHL
jgi:hypothetical protein